MFLCTCGVTVLSGLAVFQPNQPHLDREENVSVSESTEDLQSIEELGSSSYAIPLPVAYSPISHEVKTGKSSPAIYARAASVDERRPVTGKSANVTRRSKSANAAISTKGSDRIAHNSKPHSPRTRNRQTPRLKNLDVSDEESTPTPRRPPTSFRRQEGELVSSEGWVADEVQKEERPDTTHDIDRNQTVPPARVNTGWVFDEVKSSPEKQTATASSPNDARSTDLAESKKSTDMATIVARYCGKEDKMSTESVDMYDFSGVSPTAYLLYDAVYAPEKKKSPSLPNTKVQQKSPEAAVPTSDDDDIKIEEVERFVASPTPSEETEQVVTEEIQSFALAQEDIDDDKDIISVPILRANPNLLSELGVYKDDGTASPIDDADWLLPSTSLPDRKVQQKSPEAAVPTSDDDDIKIEEVERFVASPTPSEETEQVVTEEVQIFAFTEEDSDDDKGIVSVPILRANPNLLSELGVYKDDGTASSIDDADWLLPSTSLPDRKVQQKSPEAAVPTSDDDDIKIEEVERFVASPTPSEETEQVVTEEVQIFAFTEEDSDDDKGIVSVPILRGTPNSLSELGVYEDDGPASPIDYADWQLPCTITNSRRPKAARPRPNRRHPAARD